MTETSPTPHIAVVGAGITGLTAAFRLQQAGLKVSLYETSHRVGGVIRSVSQDGFLAEFGPNSILETSPKISALIRDLGLESRRLYSQPAAENRYIVRGKKPVAMPLTPAGFFKCTLFTREAKMALLKEPLIRRAPADLEESVEQFVLRRLGREFLDYAINPMVAGIYAGNPAKLSVTHAFPKLRAVEQKYGSLILGQVLGAKDRKKRGEVSKQDAKKVSFDQGLQVLPETLREKLLESLHLKHQVRRLEKIHNGWRLTATTPAGEVVREHTAVLLTAPAYRLAEIEIANAGPFSLKELGDIPYPPVASVVLGYRRSEVEHPLDGFGMLIPQVEGFSILGSLFSSTLFPGRAPEGHVTLTTYVGGARQPELAPLKEEELILLTTRDLGRILGITGKPVFRHVVFYPRAIPQYEVGFGKYKQLMDTVESGCPGLFLAGHFRNGISLGDSIIAAHDVAERIQRGFPRK